MRINLLTPYEDLGEKMAEQNEKKKTSLLVKVFGIILALGKSGFGSVMIVDFSFINKSKYVVKDIEVKCSSYANSGTLIDENKKTIYKLVSPGSTKKVTHFNMGFLNSQATSTSCSVADLVVGNE